MHHRSREFDPAQAQPDGERRQRDDQAALLPALTLPMLQEDV